MKTRFTRKDVQDAMYLGVEFGFKQCEKGNNLEMALHNAKLIWNNEPARYTAVQPEQEK